MSPDAAVADVLRWPEPFIEGPHPVFGRLPVSPFARVEALERFVAPP